MLINKILYSTEPESKQFLTSKISKSPEAEGMLNYQID